MFPARWCNYCLVGRMNGQVQLLMMYPVLIGVTTEVIALSVWSTLPVMLQYLHLSVAKYLYHAILISSSLVGVLYFLYGVTSSPLPPCHTSHMHAHAHVHAHACTHVHTCCSWRISLYFSQVFLNTLAIASCISPRSCCHGDYSK